MKPYSTLDLNAILAQFSVADKEYTLAPLTDGFINDTFLVRDNEVPLYILQRVNHHVFKDVSGVMNNIKHALNDLKATDYSNITLVETKAGHAFLELKQKNAGYWRMMTYIKGSTAHNTTTDPTIAFEAGRIIGRFHSLLHTADHTDYVDTIPNFHDLNLRKKQFEQALTTCTADKKGIAESPIAFTRKILSVLEKTDLSRLPFRICHNDTKLNNILFSRESDKALCLIDLDTLMKGRFLYDFGDAVRTIANTAPEDEKDHTKITFEKNLFEAFVEGLSTNVSMFSEDELRTMPWGAVLMPFLHGIRALTDYMNGNIYYKVAYENQNLDRCLSLFDFTQKALNEMSYMKTVVEEKLR